MYKLKPVFGVILDVQNSCSMYKLKNLHEKPVNIFTAKSHEDFNDGIQLSDQEIEVLLKKQNKVLNTLEQIELRLSKLDIQLPDAKDSFPINSKQFISSLTPCNVVTKKCEKKSEFEFGIENLIKTDTVVFADPEDPPYCLLAMPILWPAVSWDISYHVHSSVTTNLKVLETIRAFENVRFIDSNSNKTTVKVFVIWQHTKPSPKVVRSPTDMVVGEVSLLQLFNQYLATEKLVAVETNSDIVLDLINEISCSTNDHISMLYSLINISNMKLDITNIAVWSLLCKKDKIPPKIRKWLEQLTKMIIS